MMSRTHISPLIKAQLEKLTSSGIDISSGHRSMYSSSPIIIPKKPPRSNTPSQRSSSCTSVADQMSSSDETSLQFQRELDSESNSVLPMLSTPGKKLEHSAARDRIAVKCKRQKSVKNRLTSLREADDNKFDTFSLKFDENQYQLPFHIQSKLQSQSAINLSELKNVQENFRTSVRSRDHSADDVILPAYGLYIQRSASFKHSQDANEETFYNRPLCITRKQEEKENKHESILEDDHVSNSSSIKQSTSSSSQEHIYDNSNIFTHPKVNITPDIVLTDEDSSINSNVKIRGPRTSTTNHLRPVTMYTPTNNDKQTNEFENVLNQIKSHPIIRQVQQKGETVPTSVERISSRPTSTLIEGMPALFFNEKEPPIPIVKPVNKISESSIILQISNQRRTSSNINLSPSNKVFTNDHQSEPSWIGIAKQKQTKFQSEFIEKPPREEPQHQSLSIMVPKKQISKSVEIIKQENFDTKEFEKKSTVDPVDTQQVLPRLRPSHTHAIERDSIRALKANNRNRINNLIQLFNK